MANHTEPHIDVPRMYLKQSRKPGGVRIKTQGPVSQASINDPNMPADNAATARNKVGYLAPITRAANQPELLGQHLNHGLQADAEKRSDCKPETSTGVP